MASVTIVSGKNAIILFLFIIILIRRVLCVRSSSPLLTVRLRLVNIRWIFIENGDEIESIDLFTFGCRNFSIIEL
jgi:hypothetical protein